MDREPLPLLLLGFGAFVFVSYVLRCLFQPGESKSPVEPCGGFLLVAGQATAGSPPWTGDLSSIPNIIGGAEPLAWESSSSTASSSSSNSDLESSEQVEQAEQASSTPLRQRGKVRGASPGGSRVRTTKPYKRRLPEHGEPPS